MTPSDALTQTHDLLSHVGWCQGAAAKDVHGKNVAPDPRRQAPVQFSLDGALQWVTWPNPPADPDDPKLTETMEECMYQLAKLAGMRGDVKPWAYLISWNDDLGRTREQVVGLVTQALAKEEE